MMMRIASICVLLICTGCAGSSVAPLGHIFSVPPGKTAEQARANNHACEEMANLKPAASPKSSGLGGLSHSLAALVSDSGEPSYDDRDLEVRSAVWVSCMREAGFGVLPPGRHN
jgi:hypothetical protein